MGEESALDWQDFCGGSQLWEPSLLNSTHPDLSPCFQETVLSWLPLLFLWVVAPFYLYYMRRHDRGCIQVSCLHRTKMLFVVLLILISLAEVCFTVVQIFTSTQPPAPVYLISPAIVTLTMMLVFFIIHTERIRGRHTSGVLFCFWLLLAVCGVAEFNSKVLLAFRETEYDTFRFGTFFACYALVLGQLVCSAIADSLPLYSVVRSDTNPCPEASASFLSRLTFSWFTSMVILGFKRALTTEDLWNLLDRDKARTVVPRFLKEWDKERFPKRKSSRRKQKKTLHVSTNSAKYTHADWADEASATCHMSDVRPNASLLKAIVRTFGGLFLIGSLLKLVTDVLVFASPELLKQLIRYTEDKSIPRWQGYFYAFLIFAAALVQSVLQHQHFHITTTVGMQLRTAIIGAIYRKSLVLSNSARRSATTGEIINLMSVDAQRCMDLCTFINTLWASPLQVIIALYLLWQVLGPVVMAGFAVTLLLIPVNAIIAVNIRKLQALQMEAKDSRIKLMSEILNGIKVLKLYAWENSFRDKVMEIRKRELKVVLKASILGALMTFIWTSAPFFVLLTTFAIYVSVNESNILDAEKVFVSVALFNVLRLPLAMLPGTISQVIQASVSVKRIQNFLKSDELDLSNVSPNTWEIGQTIMVKDAEFSWSKDESPVLQNITMQVKDEDLVAIVGQVGAGKSSLLSALLGEMEKQRGTVAVQGSVAYVPQQAWIQNATLRDNITFGKPLQEDRYQTVIEACALVPDLDMLPGGDLTEIGEKGINLSGGQKQRVSLARAVYSDADIYLLDDPLSAVDSHVGKHIFDKVIGPEGLLRRKTRVLVTHGVGFLPRVDHIIVLVDGEITEAGSYAELLSRNQAFAEFLRNYSNEAYDNERNDVQGPLLSEQMAVLGEEGTSSIAMLSEADQSQKFAESVKMGSISGDSVIHEHRHQPKTEGRQNLTMAEDGDTLIEAETSETGTVQLSVFRAYISALGSAVFFVVVLCFVLYNLASVLSNIWLSRWSNEVPVNGTQPAEVRDRYLGVYAALGVAQGIMLLLASFFLSIGVLRAARSLYQGLLSTVLRAPMAFFDTTPMGRILNRFSKDTHSIDDIIPNNLAAYLAATIRIVATLIVISWSTPVFCAVVVPTTVVYLLVQRFYIATSRQLKRLESVTRSPIYSHFSETIAGTSSIRAYRRSESFILRNELLVDSNQLTYYPNIASNRWMSLRLELLGNILVFFAALFAVIGRDYISSGIVGLSVSYALLITGALTWLVHVTCDLETNIVAVERVKEYTEVKTEAAAIVANNRPDQNWPGRGRVEVESYSVRYREGLDLVLRDISCIFKAKEKIGIVGRTGAGKSSLTLSLFRILEAAAGSIKIDDLDISTIGLQDLRSRITIIPQDPVLFAGSLRMNLDPFDQYSDEALWDALQHSHLYAFVSGLPEKLEYECTEGGDNLSLGQRQLICLARALLRKTKILVLDEATAAVDLETDDLIQATIRTEFADCTVITIAHRLNTIMDSTRVLVLDGGEIAEFDEPTQLLKAEGVFYGMAKDAGLV
ncbi:multidrug resistance-associated protein 1-like [Acanthaster planci]|uniref:Multidrug resistance-associated protein 1-like n=1 Tax=Acanthaster planci TaxID=133434 RepID=A0A8B7YJW2_ACAPL|nr:multidrug resistance-associated protein 1-like [Acanthaster planci]